LNLEWEIMMKQQQKARKRKNSELDDTFNRSNFRTFSPKGKHI
jgi:hypothetical protein